MQWPDAQHIVDLPFVLCQGEHPDKNGTSNTTRDQRAEWMHQVGAGTDGDQTCQWAVVGKTGVVFTHHEGDQSAASHGHEGVHGDQAVHLVQRLCAHDIEAKPADCQNPGAQGEERDIGRRMGGNAAFFVIATTPCTQQQHRRQGNPSTHSMDDDRTGEVVELFGESGFEPGLHAEMLIPRDAFKEGVDQPDQHGGCQ